MQEALDQYGDSMHLKRGEIKTGKIISKTEGGFLIDVGFKCEGFLPMKEYTNHSLIEASEEPKPGDEIEVAVVVLQQFLLDITEFKAFLEILTKVSVNALGKQGGNHLGICE